MSLQDFDDSQGIRDVAYWRNRVVGLIAGDNPDQLREFLKEINRQDCWMLENVLNINNDECPLRWASHLETHGCYEVLL